MDEHNHEFEDLVKNNKIYRFVSQLKHCNKCDKDNEKKLKDILSNLQKVTVKKTSKSTLQDHFKKVNEQQFMKDWYRLKPHQKEDRLKEFIKRKELPKKISDQLLELLENGTIKATTEVDYDTVSGKLVDVKCLTTDDDNDGEYIIVLKKRKRMVKKEEPKGKNDKDNKETKKPTKKKKLTVKKIKKLKIVEKSSPNNSSEPTSPVASEKSSKSKSSKSSKSKSSKSKSDKNVKAKKKKDVKSKKKKSKK